MYIGTQHQYATDDELRILAQLGIVHVRPRPTSSTTTTPGPPPSPAAAELRAEAEGCLLRSQCEECVHGMHQSRGVSPSASASNGRNPLFIALRILPLNPSGSPFGRAGNGSSGSRGQAMGMCSSAPGPVRVSPSARPERSR